MYASKKRDFLLKKVISLLSLLLLPSNLILTNIGFPKNSSQQASGRVVLILVGCFLLSAMVGNTFLSLWKISWEDLVWRIFLIAAGAWQIVPAWEINDSFVFLSQNSCLSENPLSLYSQGAALTSWRRAFVGGAMWQNEIFRCLI